MVCKNGGTHDSTWSELIINSRRLTLSSRTVVGVDFLELGPADTAAETEDVGLNILSEVVVERDSWDGADFVESRQTVGIHNGYLRPDRMLFVSKRVYAALPSQMKRSLRFEVVHFA